MSEVRVSVGWRADFADCAERCFDLCHWRGVRERLGGARISRIAQKNALYCFAIAIKNDIDIVIDRTLRGRIAGKVERGKAIILIGLRQVGKTTSSLQSLSEKPVTTSAKSRQPSTCACERF